MTLDLFSAEPVNAAPQAPTPLGDGAVLCRGAILPDAETVLGHIASLTAQAPFRRLYTPGGRLMSAALSSCGRYGWTTDRTGYRYQTTDPLSGRPWPALPVFLFQLAQRLAAQAGYSDFAPNSCLINRYGPGSEMGLHQDRDENDISQPIVSLSLGLPCVFLWGGADRQHRPRRIPLLHGDAFVWGQDSRLFFHGIHPLANGSHPLTGRCRYNLTFRYVVSMDCEDHTLTFC